MQRSLEVIHTYSIQEQLYSRGMAQGYRARDEQLEDLVILEVVPMLGEIEARRDSLSQYRSIAVKIMRLRHPNIVAIRDVIVGNDQFTLIRQFDSGVTLDTLLSRSRGESFDRSARASLCKDILRGLAALHQHNIVHRDMKAAAVYVKDSPEPLAQIDHFHLAVSTESEYLETLLCGTPNYMAPELIEPPYLFSRQSDVYAAGLVLVEVLSGLSIPDLMHSDGYDGGTPISLLSYVRSRGRHVSVERIREVVPREYAEVLAVATMARRADRFADCRAFYETFALNAPLRLAVHDDPTGPETLVIYLERLPDTEARQDLLTAQQIAAIDPKMALAKCRQIVETIAQRVYSRSVGPPGTKPLVNLIHELRELQVIPADVFTHYYNVRKQGNLALHGGGDGTEAFRPDVVRTVLGAAVRIATWYLLEYESGN